MTIAFVIYDGFNLFELAGILEPLERLRDGGHLPGLEWRFCSRRQMAVDKGGLKLADLESPSDLSGFDAVAVPGGPRVKEMLEDGDFLAWLATAGNVRWKIALSSGSLLLGAAGLLEDRIATTHPDAVALLKPFCKEAVTERIVEDGGCITSAGAGTAIDLGLYLCRRWAGDEADLAVRYAMDYRG